VWAKSSERYDIKERLPGTFLFIRPEKGATNNPGTRDKYGRTPLLQAVQRRHSGIVKLLWGHAYFTPKCGYEASLQAGEVFSPELPKPPEPSLERAQGSEIQE